MAKVNSLGSNKNIQRKDIIITIFLGLYVFSSYWPIGRRSLILGSLVLYAFLGLTLFKLITKQTPLKITAYSIGYLVFGILGAISFFYALDSDYVFSDLYLIFVALILTFSFIQYVQDYSGFVRIFSFYAYLPIFLVLFFYTSGTFANPGQRLGNYEFGNANNLAIAMMISLCCVLWFLVNAKRKYFLLNIICAIVFLYVISLSGGRKYLLIPFIFLLLVLIFNYWNNKPKLILYGIVFALILFAGIWAVINIPVLYNKVGIRYEGLLNFAEGDLFNTDSSTLIRAMMIENGWRWFLQQPLQGYGLNNFGVLISGFIGWHVYAHNNFIELMVDLGAVGLILYYSLYVYIIAKLFCIKNDVTGIRNFFLAFMLALLFFEIGAVTYQLYIIQIFVGLASAYIWIQGKNLKVTAIIE